MTNTASPPNTSRLFLLIAIALGILATVLAFVLIQTGAGASRGPKDHIVVAKHDLTPNMAIDPDRDLMLADISPEYKSMKRGNFDWVNRAGYKGQRVNRDILLGQPVNLADFAAVGDLVLDEPYRALSLPAETGMIIPGDRVKIIIGRISLAPASPDTPTVFDSTIIGPKDPRQSGFKVLAVGGYLFKTRSQVTALDQYSSAAASQKSVTLQVTEPEARELVGALTAMGAGQKATLLICPSEHTRTVVPENKP